MLLSAILYQRNLPCYCWHQFSTKGVHQIVLSLFSSTKMFKEIQCTRLLSSVLDQSDPWGFLHSWCNLKFQNRVNDKNLTVIKLLKSIFFFICTPQLSNQKTVFNNIQVEPQWYIFVVRISSSYYIMVGSLLIRRVLFYRINW